MRISYVDRILISIIRADQLMIQDDPAFLLDLALPGLDIDLSALNISASESSLNSSILSAHPQPSSLSSGYEPDVSMFGHAVPSSGGAEDGNLGGFQLPSGISGSVHDSVGVAHIPYDDVAFNIDPGFSFDDDGLMIEGPLSTESVTRVDNAGTRSDFTAGARVRQGLPAGLSAGRPEVSSQFDWRNSVKPRSLILPSKSVRTDGHRRSYTRF